MRLIILDTETTGIPDKDPLARIIEVGAIVVEWDGKTVQLGDTFESICNPGRLFWGRPACKRALEINQLAGNEIAMAPPSELVGYHLRAWIRSQSPDAMASYGNEFDFDPLLLGAPEWLRQPMQRVPLAPCIRTVAREANGLGQYDRGYQLGDMMRRYGIAREGDAHAALSDAIAAARLIAHVYPWPTPLDPVMPSNHRLFPFTRSDLVPF